MDPEETPEPDWDLLPRFPVRFFGLEGGFDRRDLKRAYNRLLRRYKPEKFPEEFKRLRAAFEDLEDALRRGIDFGGVLEEALEADPEQEGEEPFESVGFDCLAALDNASAESVAQALAKFEPKSSDNWCQLALMREEFEGDRPLVFYETLMDGVRATQSAHSVSALLYAACSETVAPELRLSLLERMHDLCAEGYGELGICAEGFFYLTERLWIDLARSMEFSEFADLLERERTFFGEAAFEGYLGLLIQLLPGLGLRGDPDWVDEATALIDEHYHRLTPGAQNAVIEFDWVDRYRGARDRLLNGNPLRAKIDEVLVKLSEGDPEEGRWALADLFATIRDDPDALLDAFEPGEEDEWGFVLDPIHWFVEEHGAGLRPRPLAPPRKVHREVGDFARRVESRTDRSALGLLWLASTFGSLIVMLGLLLVLPCMVIIHFTEGQVPSRVTLIVSWLIFVLMGRVFGVSLRSLVFAPSSRWNAYFSDRIYWAAWREMLMEFFSQTRFTRDQVLGTLVEIDDPGITNNQFLVEIAAGDVAISLHALALQYGEGYRAPRGRT